jgi:hypothetical protein
MTYADARRLRKGDYVLIHTSEVIFGRVKRWVRARVVSLKYNKVRPEVPDIVIRIRGSKGRWLCDGTELRRARARMR